MKAMRALSFAMLGVFLFGCSLTGNGSKNSSGNVTDSSITYNNSTVKINLVTAAVKNKVIIESSESRVTNATVTLTGPDGNSVSKTWNSGDSTSFIFQDVKTGNNTISVSEIDESGTVNTASNVINITTGYNYYVTVKLGGNITVQLNDGSTADKLVAEYLFNGNANDTSGYGNDGTIYGATPAADRFGNAGQAYYFDGTSYIDCGNGAVLNFDDQITVSVWMYPESYYNGRLIGKSDNYATAGWNLDFSPGANQLLKFEIFPKNDLFTPSEFSLDTWHHISATYRKSDGLTKLYVNGILVSQTNFTMVNINFATDLTIGRFFAAGTAYFRGIIDDVRIYNNVLSDDEIQNLYHEGGWGSAD